MKRTLLGISALLAMLLLILDTQTGVSGTTEGVQQCIQVVIPSLFPFFFLSPILCRYIVGSNMRFLRPLGKCVGIPPGSEGLLLLGFLGGYPVGAQAVVTAWQEGQLSAKTAKRMLGFCSNAGPSFIFGMAGAFFSSPAAAWLLWCIQIVSAILVGIFLPGKEGCNTEKHHSVMTHSQISITDALKGSLQVTGSVCGWIILFRVLIAFLEKWIIGSLSGCFRAGISGFLELANGCLKLSEISSNSLRFILCGVLLSFGGLCVWLQTCSVAGKLGTGYYLPGKLLQCALSFILSWVISNFLFPSELNIPWIIPTVSLLLILSAVLLGRKSANNGGNCISNRV